MSFAEDLQRPTNATPSRAALNRPLRKTLGDIQARVSQDPSQEIGSARRVDPVSTEASLELLERASKGMTFIINRYKHLEEHIKQLDAWSNAQIQAAEAAAARWKDAAAAAEKKLEEAQRNLEQVARRAEAADQALQRDKEALSTLQDRIVTAFGFGSEAHEALTVTLDVQ